MPCMTLDDSGLESRLSVGVITHSHVLLLEPGLRSHCLTDPRKFVIAEALPLGGLRAPLGQS